MLGLKTFASAATTIACIELLHRIRKEQLSLKKLRLEDQATPAI